MSPAAGRRSSGTLVDTPSRHASVRFDERCNLVFAVHDIGELPQEVFGHDEYEFWYTVPANRLCEFALLAGVDPADPITGLIERWSGEQRFSELSQRMHATEYIEFTSW